MTGPLLLVRHGNVRRVLGTVTFSGRDASIYLRAIGAATAKYDYGFAEVPAGTATVSFETSGQLQASERPHVSIHESGACHVRSGNQSASRIHANQIAPLKGYTGQHVGTVLTGDIAALPLLEDVWPDVGSPDELAEPWDVTPPSGSVAIRARVHVSRNSQRPQKDSYARREFQRRRADGGVLFVAVEMAAETASLGHDFVGVIGGWDPVTSFDLTTASRFVYVRDFIAI